jgi:hypothetical protein
VANASLEPMPEQQQPDLQQPEALRYESDWENWFDWRPVRLYMTGRLAWLRTIYRRNVSRSGVSTCDTTDQPDQFATPGFES